MSAKTLAREWPQEVQRMLEAYQVETLVDLARAMGLSKSAVTNWTQRGHVPGDMLKQAAKDTGRSLDWLSFGNPPFGVPKESELSDKASAPAENLKSQPEGSEGTWYTPPAVLEALQGVSPVIAHPEKRVTFGKQIGEAPPSPYAGRMRVEGPKGPMEYCFVPRYHPKVGPTATNDDLGSPGEIAFETDWMKRTLGRIGQGFCLVDVSGSHMEPTFYEGDLVVVDRQRRDLAAGGLFALKRGSHVVVRRFQGLQMGGVRIISDNPAFMPEVLTPEALSTLDVLGKVVWPRSR